MTQTDSHHSAAQRNTALTLSLLVIALCLATLAGWVLDVEMLRSVLPGRVSMKPNTAAGMLACAFALALLSRANVGAGSRLAATAASGAAFILGGLSLIEATFGWDLYVDQRLFRDLTGPLDSAAPGQMAPSTAFCLILMGTALALASRSPRLLPVQRRTPLLWALGAMVALVGVLALLGQLLAVFDIRLWNYAGMAINTALGFVLLGCALLAWVRSQSVLAWSLDVSTSAGFAIGVVAILSAAGVSYSYTYRLQRDAVWVSHTQEVLKEIHELMAAQKDLTLSLGRYLITHDENSLLDRARIKAVIDDDMERIRSLTADNAHQQNRINQLLPLTRQRVAMSDQIIAGLPKRIPSVSHGRESALGDEYPKVGQDIDHILNEMEAEENALLQQRQSKFEGSTNRTFLLMPVAEYVCLTMLLLGLFWLNRGIAERKQVQMQLVRNEAELSVIFDNMTEGIVVMDLERNVLHINQVAIRHFGFVDTGGGRGIAGGNLEVYLPDGELLPETQWPSRRAARGDYVHNLELAVRRKDDGLTTFVEFNTAPVFSETREVSQFIVSFRDVTQRRRAEEARHESETYFHTIFEAAPDGMLIADRERKIIIANPAAERMFGYAAGTLAGAAMDDLVPAANRESLLRDWSGLMHRSAAARAVVTREIEAERHDGTIFPVELTRNVFETQGGLHVLGVVRDIAERRLAEEDRAWIAAIVQSSNDAIVGKSLDGIVSSWNRGAEKIFGYSAAEMTGQSILRIVPTDRAQEESGIQSRIRRGETIEHFETVRQRKDGRLIEVSVTVSPIRDAAGNIIGASKIARDITQTKLLEAQLRQSQKMEAIGMLASGIAHDFNNILGAMLGNVELAREDIGDNPRAKESLDEIRKAGNRARELVRQIVAFGRRQPPRRVVIALAPLVEESVRLLRATLPARVSIQGDYAADAPNVLADATQVQQVLLNLGTNAAHAMQGQRGRIDVRVGPTTLDDSAVSQHPDLLPGRYARVVFSDTGHGMDAETRKRIFEPFFTTKAQGEGTGLGMYAVQEIMRDHEGAITLQSEPGKGSSFELYFPDACAEAAVEAEPAAATDNGGHGQRVLYIDDDDAMVFLVTRMLQRRGYQVSGYTDPLLGLKALREDPAAFDLALSDHNMPGMSGVDVAREIRDIRPDLPVALASGYINDALRMEAAEAGVREIVFKPNVVEDFCDVVHSLAQNTGKD